MASIAAEIRVQKMIRKAAGLRTGRKRRAKPKYPSGARLAYYKKMKVLLERVERIIEDTLYPVLPQIVAEAEQERGGVRQDASIDIISRTFERMRALLGATVRDDEIEADVRETASDVNSFSRAQTQNEFKSVLGVELLQAEQRLGPTMEAFVVENVKRIKSIPEEFFADVERTVIDGVRQGHRVELIREQIQKRFKVGRKRAALIARDQVGKLQGQLTRQRHQNVGIDRYIWDTSKDERVRSRHKALDGSEQYYSKPPIVDRRTGRRANPGQDYQCRCNALPVFPNDLLDAAGVV